MKTIFLICSVFLAAGCGTVREYRYPDSNVALKIYIKADSLIIENTQYGGFFSMPLSNAESSPVPTKANTAPYRAFHKNPPDLKDSVEVSIRWNWVVATQGTDGVKIENYEGKAVTSGPAVYFVNTEKTNPNLFGYAIIRPGNKAAVFYVKPEIKKSRESPGFMGWRD